MAAEMARECVLGGSHHVLLSDVACQKQLPVTMHHLLQLQPIVHAHGDLTVTLLKALHATSSVLAVQPRRRDFTRSSQGIPDWGQGIPSWGQGIPDWGQCRQPPAALPLQADTLIPAHSALPIPPAYAQHQQHGQADTPYNRVAQLGMASSGDATTGQDAANACQQGAQQQVCYQKQRGDGLRHISGIQAAPGTGAAHSRLYPSGGHLQQSQQQHQHQQQQQQQQSAALGQIVPRARAPMQYVTDVPVQHRVQTAACSSDAQQHRHKGRCHPAALPARRQPACSQGRSQQASPANMQEHMHSRQGAEQSVVLQHPQHKQTSTFQQVPQMDLYRTESNSAEAAHPSATQKSPGTRPSTAPLGMQHNRPSKSQQGHDSWQGHGECSKQAGVTDLAAMEAVLDDYKGLRAQIAEAEHQLADLQAAVMQQHIASDVLHLNSRRNGSSIFPQDVHEQAQLLAATQRLERLKGAAAAQRPAVEAVALQLRYAVTLVKC